MARAKQTDRAEVRRKYRQSQAEVLGDDADEVDDEPAPDRGPSRQKAAPGRAVQPARDARPPAARPGFTYALRAAYHPAHLREDLAVLPKLLLSRAFLAGLAMLALGIAVAVVYRDYTGGLFALQLVVAPGSALLAQLVAGFFAPRASYLLGLLIGLVQGIAFIILINLSIGSANPPLRLGEGFTQEAYNQALQTSLLWGPVTSLLFAGAAAWYRRFLALSNPRTGARSAGRGASKGTPAKRTSAR